MEFQDYVISLTLMDFPNYFKTWWYYLRLLCSGISSGFTLCFPDKKRNILSRALLAVSIPSMKYMLILLKSWFIIQS